jgi:hypothetical protein
MGSGSGSAIGKNAESESGSTIMVLSDLEPAVQTAGYGDTLAGLAGAAERLLQRLNRSLRLLQLLHQRVHRLFYSVANS